MEEVKINGIPLSTIKKVLYYCPKSPTGLRWKISRGARRKNSIAGTIKKREGGYLVCRVHINGKIISCARIIYAIHCGYIPEKHVIDHIDGNGLNNTISNLRVVTQKINARNKRKQSNNTSGKSGVYFRKSVDRRDGSISKRWVAQWVTLNGKKVTKSYSTLKYGEHGAKVLAEEKRNKEVLHLKETGGYTDRHGN